MGDQNVSRPLPAHRTAQAQNKRTQTSIPQMGSEHTIPMFERAKTVHVLDRAAIVIGSFQKTPSRRLCKYISVAFMLVLPLT
jgi:hypothetical protein